MNMGGSRHPHPSRELKQPRHHEPAGTSTSGPPHPHPTPPHPTPMSPPWQVERYKGLLLKQRDIMIQLTARLNERDEQILMLQAEVEAYDGHQK